MSHAIRPDEIADECRAIRHLVRRLAMLRGDPEQFHIDRDEIERRLGALANRCGAKPEPKDDLATRRARMAAELAPALQRRR